MKNGQHTAEQIIKILDQAQKGEKTVAALCRDHGIAEATFAQRAPGWRNAYGSMSIPEAQRLKELGALWAKENARLKRLLAERMLKNDLLKELLEKKG